MNRKQLVKVFVMIVSLAAGLSSQTYQGSISGTVTDKTGAVIPGATVSVTNIAKGIIQTLTSNQDGDYKAPNLEPGTYSVSAEAPNFAKLVKSHVSVEVGHAIRVDLRLVPGTVSETVTVTEAPPLVDTSNAVLNTTFTNTEVQNLPLQGRDFQNVVILTPGVQRSPGGGFLSVTSNGNRYSDNNWIVDGLDDNDAYYGGTVLNAEGVQGTPATHLPVDAIQEFNVQQSPDAQYGFKPGAIVNLGIKSGTNQYHGSVYYFNRNSALDARNYFNPYPEPASTVELNQYGASIGGPIVKDKLFFFVNYEGVQSTVGNPLNLNTPITVPTGDLSSSTKSIPDAIARCTERGTCSPVGLAMAKWYPDNPGTNPNDPTLVAFDFNNTNSENNGIAKMDYHINDHHQISGRYFNGQSFQLEEDANVLRPIWLSQANTRAQLFGVTWGWTPKANLTNQLRFGFNSFWQQLFTHDHNVPSTAYGFDTGVTDPLNYGFPEIRVSGFNRLGGSHSWPLLTVPNHTWEITDDVSWIVGKHSLSFGGIFMSGSTDNTRNTYGKGRIDFRSVYRLVSGDYRTGRVYIGNSHRNVSQNTFGFFLQDNWRMTPRFTLTAGLRWDVSLPITESNNLLGNFDPAAGLQQVGLA